MKLTNIFSTLLGGALLFGAASCTDEVEYSPADAVAGQGVYLSANAPAAVEIETDATETSIQVFRSNTEGSFTAKVKANVTKSDGTPATDIFTLPTQVTFPDGVAEVPFTIGVNFSKVVPLAEYYLTVAIEGNETTPYGVSSRSYTLIYAPWGEIERYGGNDDFATVTLSAFSISDREVPAYERKSLVSDQIQYIFGCVGMPGYEDITEDDAEYWNLSYVNGYNMTVTVEDTPIAGTDGRLYACQVTPMPTGDESLGGMLYVTDVYTYRISGGDIFPGNTEAELHDVSYFDSETGRITIYAAYYTDAELLTAVREYIQLPGYKSYALEFTYTGNYVDNKGNESAIVEAYRSDDVASFAYSLSAGALTDDQIDDAAEAIVADADAELIYDQTSNLSFDVEAGTYTIVGVGYDTNGKQVCTGSLTFAFESVQKESDWESLGYCEYTDGLLYGHWSLNDGSDLGGQTWDVEVEKSKKTPGLYRLVNPYYEWPMNVETGYALTLPGNYYMEFMAAKPDQCYIIDGEIGVDMSPLGVAGAMSVQSDPYNFLSNYPIEVIAQAGYCGTNDNGFISFPACTMVLRYGTRAVWSNLSEEAIDAFNNGTFDQGHAPGTYGTGMLSIDLSTIARAPRHRSAAATRHTGNLVTKNVPGTLRMPIASKKPAIKATVVSGKELLGNMKQANRIK